LRRRKSRLFMREPMAPRAQRDQIIRPVRPALPAWNHMMNLKEMRRAAPGRGAAMPIAREHGAPHL